MKNRFEVLRLRRRVENEWFASRGGDSEENREDLVMAGKDHSQVSGTPFPYESEQHALRHLNKLLDVSKDTTLRFISFWNGVLDEVGSSGEPAGSHNTTVRQLRAV